MKRNRNSGALDRILGSKDLSRRIKIRNYNSYKTHSIVQKKNMGSDKEGTEASEKVKKNAAKMYGRKKTDNVCERRTNREIYELFNETATNKVFHSRRVEWLDHKE